MTDIDKCLLQCDMTQTHGKNFKTKVGDGEDGQTTLGMYLMPFKNGYNYLNKFQALPCRFMDSYSRELAPQHMFPTCECPASPRHVGHIESRAGIMASEQSGVNQKRIKKISEIQLWSKHFLLLLFQIPGLNLIGEYPKLQEQVFVKCSVYSVPCSQNKTKD